MTSSLSRALTSIAAALTLSTAGACATDTTSSTPSTATSSSSSSTSSPSTPSTSPSQDPGADGEYRDGTYTAKGWYGGGPSSVDVEVTLDDDRITAVEVTPNATNPTSLDYQNRFISGVDEAVVGRDIDEVELDRIAGSSTTPDGFNDALRQIRTEAAV